MLFQVECRITLDIAFCCSRSNVESHSTALSVVPGRMSSHARRCFPTFQVECRVTFDSAFRPSGSNVESHSTALSAVPGPSVTFPSKFPFPIIFGTGFDVLTMVRNHNVL